MEIPGEAAEDIAGAKAMPEEKGARTGTEWYVDASAAFSSLLIESEIARIARSTAEVESRAHNLGVLWMQVPFQKEVFIEEAASIVRQSEEIGENVATLKNTVVRFMRARNPERPVQVRRIGKRRRIGRHDTGTFQPPAINPAAGGSQ